MNLLEQNLTGYERKSTQSDSENTLATLGVARVNVSLGLKTNVSIDRGEFVFLKKDGTRQIHSSISSENIQRFRAEEFTLSSEKLLEFDCHLTLQVEFRSKKLGE